MTRKLSKINYELIDRAPVSKIINKFYSNKLTNKQMLKIINCSGEKYGWLHARTLRLRGAYEER